MNKSYVPDWATHYTISNPYEDSSTLEIVFLDLMPEMQKVDGARRITALHQEFIDDVCQQIKDRPLEDRMVMPKQERYKVEGSDDDYVDSTYKTITWERFVGAMQWTIGKYFDRFGRKDDIVSEAYKIKDYANRFYEKALIEAEKRKKVDEVV